MAKILIVGAGFSGAVIAQQLAANTNHEILVVDSRHHVGGNCHTERHLDTDVMVHVYGPHIFHTSNELVWNYVRQFGAFGAYANRVKAVTARGIFSLPINLLTINQVFGKKFNPREAEAFLKTVGDQDIGEPANFEEQALKLVGRILYETFFRDYTLKQWGCDPKELPASILKRLPVRFTYNDIYYNSTYQGIPLDGYTELVLRMLADRKISVKLNQRYDRSWNAEFDYIFYSGPLDAYFDYRSGRLGYRTIFFKSDIFDGDDYQGNPVINYCEATVPYTRVHEHRHFAPWEQHRRSIVFREYSRETVENDTPYYPKRLKHDMTLLAEYRQLAEDERKVTFLGRLGTYRYMDMHEVIGESLEMSRLFVNHVGPWESFSRFANARH